MFGTVFKNTVLFLLIIFILHFMINNLLIDMDLNGFDKNNEGPLTIKTTEIDNSKMVEVDRAQPERSEKKDDDAIKMKELYDYVYEKDANKNLDGFFKKSNDIDANNSNDVQVKCVDSLCSNVNNYCNTSLPIKL